MDAPKGHSGGKKIKVALPRDLAKSKLRALGNKLFEKPRCYFSFLKQCASGSVTRNKIDTNIKINKKVSVYVYFASGY